jgi:hypothetical protein
MFTLQSHGIQTFENFFGPGTHRALAVPKEAAVTQKNSQAPLRLFGKVTKESTLENTHTLTHTHTHTHTHKLTHTHTHTHIHTHTHTCL